MSSDKRYFSPKERFILHTAAKGKCSLCGTMLDAKWEADHVKPYALGGETTLFNGQALCQRCNRQKGDSYPMVVEVKPWPANFELRAWQQRLFSGVMKHSLPDFLLVATPGSGKTIAALRVAHSFLLSRRATRVVVVCPSDSLRSQWAEEAAKIGLDLDPTVMTYGYESEDYNGRCVTYHQVANAPGFYETLCKEPTFIILDEVHHAADELTWGDSVRIAFSRACFRLLLSGTPFRTDNNPIPFVTYEDGKSKADFTYGYADALADRVCRSVFFPSYEGRMEWLSNDEIIQATFKDELSQREASRRLWTALSPQGDWLRGIIADADAKLTQLRLAGHPDAGGLIVAKDQSHAKAVAALVAQITRTEPTIVLSEDQDAGNKLLRFKESSDRWLIAVRMVSEGVDINRLRVGVYATNIMSELFFRQWVGRFVRRIKGLEEQDAYLFIPKVKELIEFAETIKEERDHQLEEEIEAYCRDLEQRKREREIDPDDIFVPGSSEASPDDWIYDQGVYSQIELSVAAQCAKELDINIEPAKLAALIKRISPGAPLPMPVMAPVAAVKEPPKFRRKNQLRSILGRLAAQLAAIEGREVYEVHQEWLDSGGERQGMSTEDDLLLKQEWLLRRIKEVKSGRYRTVRR